MPSPSGSGAWQVMMIPRNPRACADSQHTDIPVPDFTFGCYPEARYQNSSWPAIQALLQRKSDMVGWRERHPQLFHRSNWGVGPRRGLMPLLQSYANGSGAPPPSRRRRAPAGAGPPAAVPAATAPPRRARRASPPPRLRSRRERQGGVWR